MQSDRGSLAVVSLHVALLVLVLLCLDGAVEASSVVLEKVEHAHCQDPTGQCDHHAAVTEEEQGKEESAEDETQMEFEMPDLMIDMGVPQKLLGRTNPDDFLERYQFGMSHLVAVAENPDLLHILPQCKNRDPMCVQWAIGGLCHNGYADEEHFMATHCCPVCASASQLDFLTRCPMDPNAHHAFRNPGDVTRIFTEMITLEKFQKYNPTVLARPDNTTSDIKKGPWIVTFDNFLTNEESDRLIRWGETSGFKRSLDGGQFAEDGSWEPVEDEDRTSSETWCNGDCYRDPMVEGIMARLVEVVQIPEGHCDFLQLLHYDEGQFYRTHQDYHTHQVYSTTGARVLTAMFYLSDVEAGGETNFPHIDVSVQPKKGKALIWSNVADNNPEIEDYLARHQALPVKEGVKYAATAWFHQRHYKSAPEGCER